MGVARANSTGGAAVDQREGRNYQVLSLDAGLYMWR